MTTKRPWPETEITAGDLFDELVEMCDNLSSNETVPVKDDCYKPEDIDPLDALRKLQESRDEIDYEYTFSFTDLKDRMFKVVDQFDWKDDTESALKATHLLELAGRRLTCKNPDTEDAALYFLEAGDLTLVCDQIDLTRQFLRYAAILCYVVSDFPVMVSPLENVDNLTPNTFLADLMKAKVVQQRSLYNTFDTEEPTIVERLTGLTF